MLNENQQRLIDQLKTLARIDDELDAISEAEDATNKNRRELQKRRLQLEHDLKFAYAAAGSPRGAINVEGRVVVFDNYRLCVTSYRATTPYAFAIVARPNSNGDTGSAPVLVPADACDEEH